VSGAAPSTVERRHATCVAWLGRGLLIEGPSGAGKSDLAVRLIGAGGRLVADDQVAIERTGERLLARPVAMPGRVELRGLGIFDVGPAGSTILDHVLLLDLQGAAERLPEPRSVTILGIAVPATAIDPRPASTVDRLRILLCMPRVA
jgi:serine kinase of HPr protein (carbohydrate metabolism regulator)